MDLLCLFPEIKSMAENILSGQTSCGLEKCLSRTVCQDFICEATPEIIGLYLYNSFHHKGFSYAFQKDISSQASGEMKLLLNTTISLQYEARRGKKKDKLP